MEFGIGPTTAAPQRASQRLPRALTNVHLQSSRAATARRLSL